MANIDAPGAGFEAGFDSEIRFPRKKWMTAGLETVLARHEATIIESDQLTQTGEEVWITEQVHNLLFTKTELPEKGR